MIALRSPKTRRRERFLRALRRFEKADAVAEGPAQAKRVLYVFFDANWLVLPSHLKALQPYERRDCRCAGSRSRTRITRERCGQIMGAKDRIAAMRENATRHW
jgi:hypothetical protein